ncbi:MAG: hypothetical protein MJE68_17235, partial [Proteobacteria bacterium]|nr:hypothetical protein [Pseudomonadota bacterium]
MASMTATVCLALTRVMGKVIEKNNKKEVCECYTTRYEEVADEVVDQLFTFYDACKANEVTADMLSDVINSLVHMKWIKNENVMSALLSVFSISIHLFESNALPQVYELANEMITALIDANDDDDDWITFNWLDNTFERGCLFKESPIIDRTIIILVILLDACWKNTHKDFVKQLVIQFIATCSVDEDKVIRLAIQN